eukprot:6734061-Ditylum_brightwellii.AAC.1
MLHFPCLCEVPVNAPPLQKPVWRRKGRQRECHTSFGEITPLVWPPLNFRLKEAKPLVAKGVA